MLFQTFSPQHYFLVSKNVPLCVNKQQNCNFFIHPFSLFSLDSLVILQPTCFCTNLSLVLLSLCKQTIVKVQKNKISYNWLVKLTLENTFWAIDQINKICNTMTIILYIFKFGFSIISSRRLVHTFYRCLCKYNVLVMFNPSNVKWFWL